MRKAPAGAFPARRTLSGSGRGAGGAGGRLRRRRPARGGGVLELLLGTEQGVQDLLAQALGEREREPAADQPEHQDAPEAALALLLGRLAQGHGRVAQRLGRLLEVLLELL